MSDQVARLLFNVGFRAAYTGFPYLSYAIALATSDETCLHGLTKRLYPEVAQHFGVSVSAAEQAMRFLLHCFWDSGNVPLLEQRICYLFKFRPYTGEFIGILAVYFRTLQ